MEEMIKVLVDNGVAIFCVVMFVFYIFTDKKESNELFKQQNETLKEISNTQIEMKTSLQQFNTRLERLENKKE